MAEESELLMKEASEIEERRVALHAKLKAARDQRRELEEKLEECIRIVRIKIDPSLVSLQS